MYKLLCLLTAYVLISSTLIGFFVLESQSEQVNTLQTIDYRSDLIKLDGSIPLNMFISTDMSTNNLMFTDVNGYGELLEILPKYNAVGVFSAISNTVYIRGIEATDNIYTVTYSLYNPDTTDFSIISGVTNPNWFTGNSVLLMSKFENVGTNSMKIYINVVEDSSLSYALNTPIYTGSNINQYWNNNGLNKITTVLNRNSNLFSVYLNDNQIVYNCPVSFGNDELIMYAGVRIEEDSPIYIESIQSKVYLTEDKENDQNLLLIIAQLLTWNVDDQYLPSILNFILIKVPLIFLSIGLALYLRGVS